MNFFRCIVILLCGMCMNAQAAEVIVAVAANFTAPMQKIAQSFEQGTGHKAVLSFGATGHLYAQIKNGAPYQVLLAADDETPTKLEKEGLGVAASQFTYAIGKLVLWSKQPGLVDDKGAVLRTDRFQRIAVANPKLAPYGMAAVETLTHMGLLPTLQAKFVQGENIAQTYQFVATENAALGFVALSQVMVDGKLVSGSAWVVPSGWHTPIRQNAVLLKSGQNLPAAQALMTYLKTDKIKQLIRQYGYEVPSIK